MGLSPEQIGDITNRGLAIRRLLGTRAEELFRRKFDVGREARIAGGEERRLDISERQVDASEARNILAEARDKVSLEHTAALTMGVKQTTRKKKIELDEYNRIIDKIDKGESLTPKEQSTYDEAIGVPRPFKEVSPVAAERLEFTKAQHGATLERALTTTGDKGLMLQKDTSVANDWNSAYGVAESAMYVWHDPWGPDKGWTKVQLPKGLNYRQVEVSAKADGKTPYEWLKKANIVE